MGRRHYRSSDSSSDDDDKIINNKKIGRDEQQQEEVDSDSKLTKKNVSERDEDDKVVGRDRKRDEDDEEIDMRDAGSMVHHTLFTFELISLVNVRLDIARIDSSRSCELIDLHLLIHERNT
ncbi:hypothetical protein AgCh_000483 [Apium graveolens]